MTKLDISTYEKIFYPKTVAIIGASDVHTKFGGVRDGRALSL